MWRKTVVATAIVGAGLAATTGSAFAGEEDHDQDRSSSASHEDRGGHDRHDGDEKKHGDDDKHHGKKDHEKKRGDNCGSDVKTDDDGPTSQSGLVNVADTDTIVPSSLCGNNVPLNALGVQVPIQDLGLNLPVLSPSDDNGGNTSEVSG